VAAAEGLGIAPEVLVSPEAVRQLCWQGAPDVAAFLAQQGCRDWQVQQLLAPVEAALAQAAG
jgi:ribonuclease D